MTAVPVPTPPVLTGDARRVLATLDRHGTFLGTADALSAEVDLPLSRIRAAISALTLRALARVEYVNGRVLVSLTPRGRVLARITR
jgi:hypothetical protein